VATLVLFAPEALAQRPRVDPCKCGPLDVVFVIDTTGSMGGSLTAFKNNFNTILGQIQASSNWDYQLGLVTFRDSVTVMDDLAVGNTASVQAHVAALMASGGGGVPEASDEALNTAINNLAVRPGQAGNFFGTWRTGARKFVVLITDAPPAGFNDAFTVGVDDVNAHARATEAYAWAIGINAIYVPTGGVNASTLAVMQDYSTTSRGIFRQTQPSGADVPSAVLDILGSCRQPADAYIRDHVNDVGLEPHFNNPLYTSPDIKVCTSPAGCASPGVNPVYGLASNNIFVTLRNNGPHVSPAGPAGGDLHVYYSPGGSAAVWRRDWRLIHVEHDLYLAPGQVREVRIPWSNVPAPSQYSLLARWVSRGDPMSYPETIGSLAFNNMRRNNNIAWRNVKVIRTRRGLGGVLPDVFTFRPVEIGKPVALSIRPVAPSLGDSPPGAVRPFPGAVLVDLGESFAGWVRNGGKGWGFERVGETTLRIHPEGGMLVDVPPGLKTPEEGRASVSFQADEGAAGLFAVNVGQLDGVEGEDLGGMEFQVEVLAKAAPAAAVPVEAVRNAGGVELVWPHAVENEVYLVWRGTHPEFRLEEGTLMGEVGAWGADPSTALRFRATGEAGFYYRLESRNGFGRAFSGTVTPDSTPN
jgi:uncharacterized protein YegL